MEITFTKNAFQNKTDSQIKSDIEKLGFSPQIFTDEPSFVYEPHQHPEAKLLAFLKGGMKVKVENQEFSCESGDLLIIPGNTTHQAVVSEEGCTFFWSEKVFI